MREQTLKSQQRRVLVGGFTAFADRLTKSPQVQSGLSDIMTGRIA